MSDQAVDMAMCAKQYAAYMEEIKARTNVVDRMEEMHSAGSLMTGYMATDIETVYLQVRKIIELIMFANIVANKAAGLELNQTLRKGWELKKIIAELRHHNARFFPMPKQDAGNIVVGARVVNPLTADVRGPFMTEDDITKAYGKASNYLHAQRKNPYSDKTTNLTQLHHAIDYINQLTILLDHHWVYINEKQRFAVVMNAESDGRVHASPLTRTN